MILLNLFLLLVVTVLRSVVANELQDPFESIPTYKFSNGTSGNSNYTLHIQPRRLNTSPSNLRNTNRFFSPEQKSYYASDRFLKDVQKDIYSYGLSDPRAQTRLSYWTYSWVRNFRRKGLEGIPDEIVQVRNTSVVGNKTVVSYNLDQVYEGRTLNGVSQGEIIAFLDPSIKLAIVWIVFGGVVLMSSLIMVCTLCYRGHFISRVISKVEGRSALTLKSAPSLQGISLHNSFASIQQYPSSYNFSTFKRQFIFEVTPKVLGLALVVLGLFVWQIIMFAIGWQGFTVLEDGLRNTQLAVLSLISDLRFSLEGFQALSNEIFESVKTRVLDFIANTASDIGIETFAKDLLPKIIDANGLVPTLTAISKEVEAIALAVGSVESLLNEFDELRITTADEINELIMGIAQLQQPLTQPNKTTSIELRPDRQFQAPPPEGNVTVVRMYSNRPNFGSVRDAINDIDDFKSQSDLIRNQFKELNQTIVQELLDSSREFLIKYFWTIDIYKQDVAKAIDEVTFPILHTLLDTRNGVRSIYRDTVKPLVSGAGTFYVVFAFFQICATLGVFAGIWKRRPKIILWSTIAYAIFAFSPFVYSAMIILTSGVSQVCNVNDNSFVPLQQVLSSQNVPSTVIKEYLEIRDLCSDHYTGLDIAKQKGYLEKDFSDLNLMAQSILESIDFAKLVNTYNIGRVIDVGGNMTSRFLNYQSAKQTASESINITELFIDPSAKPILDDNTTAFMSEFAEWGAQPWNVDDFNYTPPSITTAEKTEMLAYFQSRLAELLGKWSSIENNRFVALERITASILSNGTVIISNLENIEVNLGRVNELYLGIIDLLSSFNEQVKSVVLTVSVPKMRAAIAGFFESANTKLNRATECHTHFTGVNATTNVLCYQTINGLDGIWSSSWMAGLFILVTIPTYFALGRSFASMGGASKRYQQSKLFRSTSEHNELGKSQTALLNPEEPIRLSLMNGRSVGLGASGIISGAGAGLDDSFSKSIASRFSQNLDSSFDRRNVVIRFSSDVGLGQPLKTASATSPIDILSSAQQPITITSAPTVNSSITNITPAVVVTKSSDPSILAQSQQLPAANSATEDDEDVELNYLHMTSSQLHEVKGGQSLNQKELTSTLDELSSSANQQSMEKSLDGSGAGLLSFKK